MSQINQFHTTIWAVSFFNEILQLDKFEGADFKYDNIAYKLQSKYLQVRRFWYQIYAFFIFSRILQLDKVESSNFKYDNVFKFEHKKIAKKGIFVPKFRNFCFFLKLFN